MAVVANPIILYDGVCGLCHRTVRFLIRRDRGLLRYAPLQGETAHALRTVHPKIPLTLESVVFVDDGRVYLRSQAFFHAAKYLRWPWRWAHHLRWLPAWVTDGFYRLIARVRYRVWGNVDSCTLPTTDDVSRLLP